METGQDRQQHESDRQRREAQPGPGGEAQARSGGTAEQREAAGTEAADNPADAAAVAALEREIAALREERLRELAETENQRRRLVRDVDQARRFANERLLGDLLPVLDNLERGLEAGGTDIARLREGVELTLKQLVKVAEDNGLTTIDPQGERFDPERHQAMSTLATSDRPAGEVVQVFQKGYELNGRLLRPAMVVVTREPDAG